MRLKGEGKPQSYIPVRLDLPPPYAVRAPVAYGGISRYTYIRVVPVSGRFCGRGTFEYSGVSMTHDETETPTEKRCRRTVTFIRRRVRVSNFTREQIFTYRLRISVRRIRTRTRTGPGRYTGRRSSIRLDKSL